jgi:hypothetical protein
MPRLLLFAACERVLFDADGLISLLTLIERLEVTVPATVVLPAHYAMPMRWQSVAVWSVDQSELGKFEQTTHLVIVENGNEVIAAHTEVKTLERTLPGSATGVKIVSTLTAVPVVHGTQFLRLLLQENWRTGMESGRRLPC